MIKDANKDAISRELLSPLTFGMLTDRRTDGRRTDGRTDGRTKIASFSSRFATKKRKQKFVTKLEQMKTVSMAYHGRRESWGVADVEGSF